MTCGTLPRPLGGSNLHVVGAANGRNPLTIVAPCHRVIGADGAQLAGYGSGLPVKAGPPGPGTPVADAAPRRASGP